MTIKDAKFYATFLYTLDNQFPDIICSEIKFFNTSPSKAVAYGTFYFNNEIGLYFREILDFSMDEIIDYSYEVLQAHQKLYYYDPQPHPGNPNLASSFPHHKHVPPDIKHNRQPALHLSFDRPNLPALIKEILDTLL